MIAARHRVTGQPVRRKEDARIITGQARWTDNLTLPGMAHLAIVRSPMAHARIGRVDVSAALERPGVVAAFTGRDLATDYGSLPTAWIVSDDLIVPDPRAGKYRRAPNRRGRVAGPGQRRRHAGAEAARPGAGGLAFGLVLGLLLGHRRRIVIMTAAAPGSYPPARTVL